ncbi:lipid A deacylase LpxR family protein [Rhodovarius lipocyclicus]|uniref:lipid A deacylase LpxR family protein n=1 Tax=Rhodovarius lipocyclicus TaxID=268410 RepID=UPI0013568191|nr:lipid A deacylase LpxR family protein [Rhodovarius lipocyclicus]
MFLRFSLSVSCLALLPGLALAQPVPEPRVNAAPPPDWSGTLSLAVENDKFGIGTDRFYSNGLQMSWRSASAALPRPLDWTNRQLEALMGPGELRWGLAISHQIFTPRDTRRVNPDPTDRPYVGMLMASISLSRASERSLTVVELQAGMVGPSAVGEQVQNGFHRAIGSTRSYGWDRQIHDEPVVNLVAERKWRMPLGQFAGLEFEAMPSASISLGNGNSYGALGGMVRFGQGLAADFGPARIRPALAGSNYFQPNADRSGREWGWYVFAGFEGRGVARDIALDGNTWRNSRHVDRRPFVGDAQAGIAVYWRDWRFSYTQIVRSEEFYGQRGGPQIFGSINAALRF